MKSILISAIEARKRSRENIISAELKLHLSQINNEIIEATELGNTYIDTTIIYNCQNEDMKTKLIDILEKAGYSVGLGYSCSNGVHTETGIHGIHWDLGDK